MTADELARGYFVRARKRIAALQREIPALADISLRLRRDRENAFYGDIDLIPDRVFGREAAQRALAGAERVLAACDHFIGPAA